MNATATRPMNRGMLRLDRLIRSCVVLALILSANSITFVSPTVQAGPIIAPTPTPESTPFISPLATPAEVGQATPTPQPTPVTEATPISTPAATPAPLPPVTPPLTATEMIVSQLGGHVASFDNRIQLDVPAGLFTQPTRVRITPRLVSAVAVPNTPRIQFDLDAYDTVSATAITTFN